MIRNTRLVLMSICVVCLAFILAACGQAKQGSLSEQDTEFMKRAAIGGMMEVELGKMVTQKASNEQVRQFGQRMVDDHSKANDSLQRLAEKKGVDLPKDLDEDHRQKVEELAKLSGKELDCAYMSEMVEDHEKDVEAFKTEAEKGTDGDVKAFAADTLKVLEQHLQMVKSTNQEVCGN